MPLPRRIPFVLAALVSFGCAVRTPPPVPAAGPARSPAPAWDDLAAVRSYYDRGFARVIAALPDSAREMSSGLWPLWALGRFRQAVGWARLDGDAYRAVQSGPLPRAWLVIVLPTVPAYRRMRGPFQLDNTSDILVAQIKPEPVTEAWAGIFLSRQLQLLADYALGATPRSPSTRQFYTSEFRGYQIELMAADLLAGGELRRALDGVITRWATTSTGAFVERLALVDVSTLVELARLVPSDPPLSDAEATLRTGFASAALLIRYCERQGIAPEDSWTLFQQWESLLRRR